MSRFARLSRKEQALVAAALLLPLPLVALVSYSAVGPGVGSGLGSPVTLHAEDERSGATARGAIAEESSSERSAGDGMVRITRRGGLVDRSSRSSARASSRRSSTAEPTDREAADRPPRESPTDAPGDGGSAGAPGEEASTPAAIETGPSEGDESGVTLTLSGQGSEVVVGVDGDGVTAGTADSGGSEPAGSVEATVTGTDGSSAGATVVAPELTLP